VLVPILLASFSSLDDERPCLGAVDASFSHSLSLPSLPEDI